MNCPSDGCNVANLTEAPPLQPSNGTLDACNAVENQGLQPSIMVPLDACGVANRAATALQPSNGPLDACNIANPATEFQPSNSTLDGCNIANPVENTALQPSNGSIRWLQRCESCRKPSVADI